MRTSEQPAGSRDNVLAAESVANAQMYCQGGPLRAGTVTIGNTDLPAFLSNGQCYVQATVQDLFTAFGEDISAFVRDMEIRVSVAGSSTLSSVDIWRAVLGETVAQSSLV